MISIFRKGVIILFISALLTPSGVFAQENSTETVAVKDYANMSISEVQQVMYMGHYRRDVDTIEVGELFAIFTILGAGVVSYIVVNALGRQAGERWEDRVDIALKKINERHPAKATSTMKQVTSSAKQFIEKAGDGKYLNQRKYFSNANSDISRLYKRIVSVEKAYASGDTYILLDRIEKAERALEKLERISYTDKTLNKFYTEYLTSCKGHLKAKRTAVKKINIKARGGASGAALVAVTGIAALLNFSIEAEANGVSNSRLVVEKVLKDSYVNNPELFAINVFILKDKLGENVVTSVLYEKREQYMPLLEKHIELINTPEVKELAQGLMEQYIVYQLSTGVKELDNNMFTKGQAEMVLN